MIKLGIVGTGGMAGAHGENFRKIKGVEMVACCDVLPEKAKAYAKKFHIKNYYGSLDEMLASEKLDAVSIVTPDFNHTESALKAIAKKINVFCEKPLACNLKDAKRMYLAAKKARIITGVNFSYRNNGTVQYAHKMISDGVIGKVIHVEASYLQSWLSTNVWGSYQQNPGMLWRLSKKHKSAGCLGDIGVHIYDMVSFIAGDFAEMNSKLEIFDKGIKRLGEYVFDANDSFVTTVKFKSGAIGSIHSTRWATGHGNSLRARIYGNKGAIEVDLDTGKLKACIGKNIHKAKWVEIKCPKVPNMYQRFITALKKRKEGQTNFTVGLKVQRYLDATFRSDTKKSWVKIG